jgi:hypothetical protein
MPWLMVGSVAVPRVSAQIFHERIDMSEANGITVPARRAKLTKIVESSIEVLAQWFDGVGQRELTKAEALARLPIPGDQYDQVMITLSDQGVIEEVGGYQGDRFPRFKILPDAVNQSNAIRSRDKVKQIIDRVRSSRAATLFIVFALGVIALSTVVDDGFGLSKHFGLIKEQPITLTPVVLKEQPITLTPVVLPCPAPTSTPDLAIARYAGQPLDFWVVKFYDNQKAEKDTAQKALLAFGKSAIPALVKALYSGDDETARLAIVTLGEMGSIAADSIRNLEDFGETHQSLKPTIKTALQKIRPTDVAPQRAR